MSSTPKLPSHVNLDTFTTDAKPLNLRDGDISFQAVPRKFSTGSVGWGSSGKVTVMVNGKPTPCQVSFNVTVIGSKPSK